MPDPVVHIEFSANNPLELAKWYADVFGWSYRDIPEMHYAVAGWSDNVTSLGAGFNPIAMGAPAGHTIPYVNTDDLDAHLLRIAGAGGTLTQPRMDVPGVGAMAWFTDPSGNMVALLQPVMPDASQAPEARLKGIRSTPQPVIHVQFSSINSIELANWYSNLFGWTVHSFPEMNYATADWSSEPGAPSAGFNPIESGAPAGYTIVHIHSDDIDADIQRVNGAGGDVFQPRFDIPNVGSVAFFRDPSGNVVALWQTAPQD